MTSQEIENTKEKIDEINAIQTFNAIIQYFPQFLFQAYLISFRNNKCIITGVSAGLAVFSIMLYLSFSVIKRFKGHDLGEIEDPTFNTRIIDNLSSNDDGLRSISPGSSLTNSNLSGNLKNFEKTLYNTDDKNFVSKKQNVKNVEKSKIFSFNKRRPIYEQEDFDMCDMNNQSTEFYEINESTGSNVKLNTSSRENDNFVNENHSNLNLANSIALMTKQSMDLSKQNLKLKQKLEQSTDIDVNKLYKPGSSSCAVAENRSTSLKRKGICSSQEMINLVDIMNDNLSAEQVDSLAKSIVELNGEESLNLSSESGELDSAKIMELFPDLVDEKTKTSILENIDAAIYENQVIFQERIRKNQLTIQNLKLQDQMLSNCIDVAELDSKIANEVMSTRDYENMAFINVSRSNLGLKHWRNYLRDIDTNLHDNSTVQNSSFYVNTMSNHTYDDLYINEIENGEKSDKLIEKKSVRWCDKIPDESCLSEDLYIDMESEIDGNFSQKNILVETINKINVDSPIKHMHSKKKGGLDNYVDNT